MGLWRRKESPPVRDAREERDAREALERAKIRLQYLDLQVDIIERRTGTPKP